MKSFTGTGTAKVAAGLALARCGDENGIRFVQERLRFLAGTSGPSSGNVRVLPEWAASADLRTAQFLAEELGSPEDVVFIPEFMDLLRDPRAPGLAKALAWDAVVRINPRGQPDVLLKLAWKASQYQGAARFIVLTDERAARTQVGKATASRGTALEQALGASPRDRRLWRETERYPF